MDHEIMCEKYYTEPLETSEPMRQLYADSIDNAVAILQKAAKKRREARITPESMAARREEMREEYARMLGIDLCCAVFGRDIPEVETEVISDDGHETISRVKLKICEGVYFTGLLLVPKQRDARAPLALMSHGGGGSPQLCCDLIGVNNYGGVVRMLLERGVVIFAPQLLLWAYIPAEENPNIPSYKTPYDRTKTENLLRQCGTSIAGFEVYEFTRALDWLMTLDFIDPERIGMLGLSYGGFYTLHTMAYETRIRCGWSAGVFNDRTRYCRRDMSWTDAAGRFLDPEIAGLCAPRPLWIDVGRTDPVFDSASAEALFPRVREFYAAAGAAEQIRCNLWDGGHRFSTDDGALEFFLRGMGCE